MYLIGRQIVVECELGEMVYTFPSEEEATAYYLAAVEYAERVAAAPWN